MIHEATANVPGGPCGRKCVEAIAISGLWNSKIYEEFNLYVKNREMI